LSETRKQQAQKEVQAVDETAQENEDSKSLIVLGPTVPYQGQQAQFFTQQQSRQI